MRIKAKILEVDEKDFQSNLKVFKDLKKINPEFTQHKKSLALKSIQLPRLAETKKAHIHKKEELIVASQV